jgi:hypothetical protein
VLLGALWVFPYKNPKYTIWAPSNYGYIVYRDPKGVEIICSASSSSYDSEACAPASVLWYSPLVLCATLLELAAVTRMLSSKVRGHV